MSKTAYTIRLTEKEHKMLEHIKEVWDFPTYSKIIKVLIRTQYGEMCKDNLITNRSDVWGASDE